MMEYIGLANYKSLFEDPVFAKSIWNDFVILFWKEVLILPIALFLAVALTRLKLRKREVDFYRFIFFIPNVLSVVLIGIVWTFIYHPTLGILNGFLKAVGLEAWSHAWLGEFETALFAIIPIASWAGIGLFMIVFIAAIHSVPSELYESANLDGAGQMTQLFRITIPMIWEQIKFSVITILFTTLSYNVNLILVTTNGGPDNSTQVMGSYVYQQAFVNLQVGFANAAAIVMLVICVILSLATNKLLNRNIEG